jgi:NitT/TauT family transport system ATP-binding protein
MALERSEGVAATPRAEHLISVRDLVKDYRTREGSIVHALSAVDFDIRDGECVTVVGPSGCGKSTLLMILAGLLPSSRGSVELAGRPVVQPRRDIGVVFQNPVLLPWKTVTENVLLPVRVQGGDVDAARTRAHELLAMVGLDGFEAKYPFELSGGMQQRNAIVRALITDPRILLMDEPFGALDAMTREQLNLDLQEIWLRSRKTIVFVTHSIPEAVFLGDRVFVMGARPGRLLGIEEVNLPRPRTLSAMTSEPFGHHVDRVRRRLSLGTDLPGEGARG